MSGPRLQERRGARAHGKCKTKQRSRRHGPESAGLQDRDRVQLRVTDAVHAADRVALPLPVPEGVRTTVGGVADRDAVAVEAVGDADAVAVGEKDPQDAVPCGLGVAVRVAV